MDNRSEITPNQKPVLEKEKTIDSREQQNSASRLLEYITGLKPDDPKMIDRLRCDQLIIRQRYGLPPDRNVRLANPAEYIHFLKNKAKSEGITIKKKNEMGSFFKENSQAGAVFDSKQNVIGCDIKDETREELLHSALELEHELIHGLQHKHYPDMPIELKEYEAYLAAWNINYLVEHQNNLELTVHLSMWGSVNFNYKDRDEVPIWDNPEWFLKNIDGMEEKEIKNLKKK